jgi:hypothetical protein
MLMDMCTLIGMNSDHIQGGVGIGGVPLPPDMQAVFDSTSKRIKVAASLFVRFIALIFFFKNLLIETEGSDS